MFFHKLAYATHEKVLGKELTKGQEPKQEIVAELSAYVLARMYGRKDPDEGGTFEYVTHYAKRLKKELSEVIVSIINDEEKVLSFIIEKAEQKEPHALVL